MEDFHKNSTESISSEQIAVNELLRMLTLGEPSETAAEMVFSAETLNRETRRVFGGQVLAQAIIAGSRTVTDDRAIHSIHGYFIRPGDVDQPLSFGVRKLNDGRSFSTRRIQAYQDSAEIFSSIASFQDPAQGPEHGSVMPDGVPKPESLPSVADLVGHVPLPIARSIAYERPFDIRHVDQPLWLSADSDQRPASMAWVKSFAPLGDDPVIHRAALAYASDYLPVEPGLRAHGKFWMEEGMRVASLDHAMWFHRPVRVDEWLLYVLDSPSAQDARSLATGKFFTADGVHVATVAQETMLRLPEFREDVDSPFQI